MRHRHFIKRNHSCETPTDVVWFDTETHLDTQPDGSIKHRLKFGWACYQRYRGRQGWSRPKWHRFDSALGFWQFVTDHLQAKRRLYTFCHNTNFDLPMVQAFSLPPKLGGKLTRAVIDAPPTIVHWQFSASTVVMLDTLNFWRVPLAKLGEAIGSPKLPMPAQDASPEAWDLYAKNDVEVIRRACLEWWRYLKESDMGGFAPTLAGQSMRIWRHRFMRHNVLIDDNQSALDLARSAYLGGRTECFRHGIIKGDVHYVDFNSMYPAVMRGRPYPTILLGFDRRKPAVTYAHYSETHATVARVKLRTEIAAYPRVIDKRLCFPVGTFWASLAGPELAFAVAHRHVIQWDSVAIYHQAEIFTEFVDELYRLRLKYKADGNETYAYFIKILMNSLYGKFGQRGLVWGETEWTDDQASKAWVEYDVDSGRIVHKRQLAGLIQAKSQEGEARESHPAIASYVTSYARMMLWDLISKVGMCNAIYCDTDSVFVTKRGYARIANLISATDLGAPKLEQVSKGVVIRGLKDYDFGAVRKVKGVKKSAHWLSDSEVRQEQWSGLRGQLSRGDLDNAITRPVIKHLSREYHKGTFNADGTVSPLRLEE